MIKVVSNIKISKDYDGYYGHYHINISLLNQHFQNKPAHQHYYSQTEQKTVVHN